METHLITLSSDSVDRYGYRIHIIALEQMLKDRMKEGIPMLFGHDQHKPVGWGKPFALYLEPHLTRLLATQNIPTTDEEKQLVLINHANFRSNKYYETSKKYLKPFSLLLESSGFTSCQVTNVNCLAANKTDIAKQQFPFLFDKSYRDCVVPFNILFAHFDYLGQGVFKDKGSEFTVFAHRFFRRSESIHNTLNAAFLDEFMALKADPALDLYLRIDENQLGYAPSFISYLELEYQWGPKYSDEIEAIKEGLARHDCDENERAYYGFSRSEFLWEWDKARNKFSFQMEELKDDESPMDDGQFHCKYVHTVFDKGIGSFEHFDAAIRTYDIYQMIDRLDKDFKSYGKESSYTKLFKANGPLPLSTWKLLVTLYLRGNPIIYEYFGLKKEYEALKPQRDLNLTMAQRLIPYSIDKKDGLRLLVSQFNIRDHEPGRYIDSFDIISDEVNSQRCIDYYFLEFKKSLMKQGGDIEIPEDVLLIKSSDNYWNIPLIMHSGPDSRELFKQTVSALTMLFDVMVKKKVDFSISVTLGIVGNDRVVQVSSYGHIHILNDWLKESMPFPENEKEFTDWLVKQREFLTQFEHAEKLPLMAELIQLDGVLYAKRTVLRSHYEFDTDPETGLKWQIDFNDQEHDYYKNSGLQMIPAVQVMGSVCHDTGEDYFTSTRSRWLDEDLKQIDINSWRPVFLHWGKVSEEQKELRK